MATIELVRFFLSLIKVKQVGWMDGKVQCCFENVLIKHLQSFENQKVLNYCGVVMIFRQSGVPEVFECTIKASLLENPVWSEDLVFGQYPSVVQPFWTS